MAHHVPPPTRRRPWLTGLLAGLLVAAAVAGTVLVVIGSRSTGSDAAAAPLPSRDFTATSVADPITGGPPSLAASAGPTAGSTRSADRPTPATATPPTATPAAGSSPAGRRALREPDDPMADRTPQVHSAAADPAQRPQRPSGALAPNRLVIPALGVDAVVATSDLNDGSLELPVRVNQVTRWAGSAAADAEGGTMLVAGHVDNRRQGTGALYYLHTLRPGDAIYLTVGGVVTRWKTVALQSFPKQALPNWVWSGTRGERRLALVTCGGAFENGHYENNVVLTAVPF